MASGQSIRKLRGHTSRVNCVRLNGDATMAVTGSYDASVRCWDLRANTYVSCWRRDPRSPVSVVVCFTVTSA